MRTTLNLDEKLYKQAAEYTGIREKTKLIHLGLQNLIQKEAAHRLAKQFGTLKGLKHIRRRKTSL